MDAQDTASTDPELSPGDAFDRRMREAELELKQQEAEDRRADRKYAMEKDARNDRSSAKLASTLLSSLPLIIALVTTVASVYEFASTQRTTSRNLAIAAQFNAQSSQYTNALDATKTFYVKRDKAYYDAEAAVGKVDYAHFKSNWHVQNPIVATANEAFQDTYYSEIKTVDSPGDEVERSVFLVSQCIIWMSYNDRAEKQGYENAMASTWATLRPSQSPLQFKNQYALFEALEQNMEMAIQTAILKEGDSAKFYSDISATANKLE